MDLYLPIDFYQLRDDLPYWRDAPVEHAEPRRYGASEPASPARDACADPLWQVV